MASTSTTPASKKALSLESQKTSKDKEAEKAAKRRYDYVPTDLEPKGPLLRIHTSENITRSMPGRIVKQWTKCEKPRSEPNRGCRTGRMGFWVETDDGYKAVLVCKRKVCDWQHSASQDDDAEHETESDGVVDNDGE